MPELMISPEKVGFLIEKARQFDVKEAASDPDSGSNATDDNMIDVLEDDGRDPVERHLASLGVLVPLAAAGCGRTKRSHGALSAG